MTWSAGRVFFLFAVLAISNPGFSQEQKPKIEPQEIYFRINSTYRVNDTMIVFLEGAENLSIPIGLSVKAYWISIDNPKRDLTQVGSGRIAKADTFTAALIKLFNQKDTLATGDVVSMELSIPQLPYRSIFSKLSFYNIGYYDYDWKLLYSSNSLINADNKSIEDSIYASILRDMRSTYDRIKDQASLPPAIREKAKEGRYAGKSVLDMLRDGTREDIKSFLTYATDLPAAYTGKRLRFLESFAGWLVVNGPYSFSEIERILYPAYKTNKSQFMKLLPQYKSSILSENAASNLCIKARTLDFKEGLQLSSFAAALADAVNDTMGKAVSHLLIAEIYQNNNRYAEAIPECDKAMSLAIQARSKDVELQAIMKKVYCLSKNRNFLAALSLLPGVEKKINEYRNELGERLYQANIQKRFEYEGSIQYDAGEFDKALQAYGKAIEINKAIDSYDALVRNAEYYKFIGRVNNDQGKPNDALESFRKSATIYRRNADTLHWALLQNEIAYAYYNLGNYRQSILYCDSAQKKLLRFSDSDNAGYSKSLTGSSYWELGKYDSAVMAHRQAIALRKASNNISGQAHSLKQIGELYLLSGLKNEALLAYDSAAQLYQQIKDSSGLAETYNKKGKVFLNDENYKTAVDFFEKAKGINSKITIESLYNLGSAWSELDSAKARRYYSQCRQKSDSTGNTGYSFDATRAIAGIAYRAKNLVLGDKLYEESVILSTQLNTPMSRAYCLELKALGFANKLQLDSAISYYDKAMQMFDTISKDEVIWQLNNISSVQLAMGNFTEAGQSLSKAIDIAKKTSNLVALGFSLEASTFLSGLMGEFEKGLADNDSAIAIFSRSGNRIRLAGAYLTRGTLLATMGDYNNSIKSYLFADSIYQVELTTDYRHTALNNIGVTYGGQGDYQNAMKYYELALKQLKKGLIDETYLLYKGNLGESQYYLKKYKDAEASLMEVFPKAKEKNLNRIASGVAIALGRLYYDQKQLAKAMPYFSYGRDYALASGEKAKIVESLTYLGRIDIQSGKPDSARTNFRNAMAVVTEYKMGGGWEPFYEYGLLCYNQKKFDSAIVYLKKSVDLLEKDAENLFGGEEAKKIFNNDPRKSDLYNKITFAYYNVGNEKEAWSYANKSNIAAIKELSGSISTVTSDKNKSEALRKLVAFQQSKKTLETTAEKLTGEVKEQTLKKIEILEADYTNFLQDIVESYPDLGAYFAKTNADEFYSYKSKIPNDVAVALYLVNDKTLMIFTLTNEKLAVDTMRADIASMVRAFISAARQPQKSTGTGSLNLRSETTDEDDNYAGVPFKDLSSQLYNTLVTPVYDRIKNKKRLCIIPTGLFSNMPFQCLGQKMPDSSFRFLVEDYGIFYTNKMKIFDAKQDDSARQNDLLSFAAFGVPDQTLHYNTREVKEIGRLMSSDSTIYADSRATESLAKFTLAHKKYIHFATHGVLNYSSQFSKSYLKFLPDKDTSNGNNGQLTIREIQSLPINSCDLVTLSACETAITKELVKGWTVSPANSFLERSVKSVVASLWKVDDEATSILMDEFYANLNKNMDKVDALRLAQQNLSKNPKYSHPFYWGAFVLYGDWR